MKTVTERFLKEHDACREGFKWFCENCLGLPMINQIEKTLAYSGDWANWLITRTLSLDNVVKYVNAARAAEYAATIENAENAEYVDAAVADVVKYAAVNAAEYGTARADAYKKIVGYGLKLLKEESKDENDN